MADNTTLSAPVGSGDVIGTDDISGVKYQVAKVAFGLDGAMTRVSATDPLPTVLSAAQISILTPLSSVAVNNFPAGFLAAQSGSWNVGVTGSVAVTGTFWQATQPISAASLPLPTGASTEATLSQLNGKVTACNTGSVTISAALPAGTNVIGHVVVDSGTIAATQSGTWTVSIAAAQTIAVTNIGTFAVQAAQSGTWTVQIGNTPNTTPILANHLDPSATTGTISAADATCATTTNSINQSIITGTPDANSSVSVTLSAHSGITIQLSATFNGTVAFERSIDGGTTFVPFSLEELSVGASVSSLTISDNKAYLLRGNAGEMTTFRVRCTARTSGTLTVKIQPGFGVSQIIANQGTAQALANKWPVQITDGTNTMPTGDASARMIYVTDVPNTSSGLSVSSFLSTAAVQSTAVKASAGQVYAIEFFNIGATPVYVRLYNQTAAPGAGDGANILWRGIVPGNTAGAGFVKTWDKGLAFGTGIGMRVSAGIADNDATNLVANQIVGNVDYK
jgi:hypothetical protein